MMKKKYDICCHFYVAVNYSSSLVTCNNSGQQDHGVRKLARWSLNLTFNYIYVHVLMNSFRSRMYNWWGLCRLACYTRGIFWSAKWAKWVLAVLLQLRCFCSLRGNEEKSRTWILATFRTIHRFSLPNFSDFKADGWNTKTRKSIQCTRTVLLRHWDNETGAGRNKLNLLAS